MHGLIFLFCAGLSVGIVRNICLSPNHDFEVIARSAEPVRRSETEPPAPAWQEPAWVHHYERPRVHVKEPALLWKEMEWGDIGMPATLPRDWRQLILWRRRSGPVGRDCPSLLRPLAFSDASFLRL